MGKIKELSYEKQRILKSEAFSAPERDMLHALLEDGRKYSVSQAKALLRKEKERVVR